MGKLPKLKVYNLWILGTQGKEKSISQVFYSISGEKPLWVTYSKLLKSENNAVKLK